LLKCKTCGGALDLTMSTCPACGAEVELGRLTGILGIVCRKCDAYNEPGARTCSSCGAPVGGATGGQPEIHEPGPPAAPATRPSAPAPPPHLDDGELPLEVPPPAAAAAWPPVPGPVGDAATPAALLAARQKPASATPGGGPFFRPAPPSRPAPPVGGQAEVPSDPPAAGQPVVRSFQRGAPSATRMVPLVASGVGAIPMVTHCPRCGEEAGPGQFCQRCGQPLGPHGTQVLQPPVQARSATAVFGPLAPGRAKLMLERGEGLDGATFRLNAERVTAGRTQGQVVFPDDPCLAPHHATFFYRDGLLHVRDEGSASGIYLRLRGPSVPIRPGDVFVVGDRLLRFGGPLPAPPPGPPDGTRRLGAPRHGGASAVIEEWLEGGVCGRVFVRPGPSITIGRAGCAVNLGDDPYLSQAHAELVLEADGTARLRDLGSANGTFVRIPSRAERELHDGDGLRLGREVLRVTIA
jgi:pSer/pThr/pTyr-binding forkhead associated (FHA) protein